MYETEELRREEVNSCQDLQTQTQEDSGNRSRSESQSCARGVRDRMSLGTIIVDARMRARSSLFVTSGVNILEGERDVVNPQSHLVPTVIKERRRMNSSWRKVGKFQSENILWNSFSGAQGVCHPGCSDGCLPHLLASFLSLVGASHIALVGMMIMLYIFPFFPFFGDQTSFG